MTKTHWIFVLGILVLITILAGCISSNSKVENAEQNLEQANADAEKARIELDVAIADSVRRYREATSAQFSHFDKSLAEFKDGMSQERQEYRARYETELKALEQKNAYMKSKLNEYAKGGKQNWASFKTEFNSDMDALGRSINAFLTRDGK